MVGNDCQHKISAKERAGSGPEALLRLAKHALSYAGGAKGVAPMRFGCLAIAPFNNASGPLPALGIVPCYKMVWRHALLEKGKCLCNILFNGLYCVCFLGIMYLVKKI